MASDPDQPDNKLRNHGKKEEGLDKQGRLPQFPWPKV